MSLRAVARKAAFGLAAVGQLASVAGCGSPSGKPSDIPCDVDAVLVGVCQRCHSSPPADKVPFSLVTYADTRATFMMQPVWMVMGQVMDSRLMPLPPVTMTDAQRATIQNWVALGAPSAPPGTHCP